MSQLPHLMHCIHNDAPNYFQVAGMFVFLAVGYAVLFAIEWFPRRP
jgi:hypothetical protein